jgi:hypothetical protein
MEWSSAVSRCRLRDSQPGERVEVTAQAYGAAARPWDKKSRAVARTEQVEDGTAAQPLCRGEPQVQHACPERCRAHGQPGIRRSGEATGNR